MLAPLAIVALGLLGVVVGETAFRILVGVTLPAGDRLPLTASLYEALQPYSAQAASGSWHHPEVFYAAVTVLLGLTLLVALRPGLHEVELRRPSAVGKVLVGLVVCLQGALLFSRLFAVDPATLAELATYPHLAQHLSVGAAWGAIAWLILGRNGWLGELGRWGLAPGTGAERLKTLGQGALFGLAAAGLGTFFATVLRLEIYAGLEVAGPGGLWNPSALVALRRSLLLWIGLSTAGLGALGATLSAAEMRPAERAVSAGLLLIIACLALGVAQTRIRWVREDLEGAHGSLAAAAELPHEEPPVLLGVQLAQPTGRARPWIWPLRRRIRGLLRSERISFRPDTLPRLQAYLLRQRRPTLYTVTAENALLAGHLLEWNLGEVDARLFRLFTHDGFSRAGKILLERLGEGATSPARLAMARELDDPLTYHLGPPGERLLTDALAHQGDITGALALLARRGGLDPSELVEPDLQAAAERLRGRLKGELHLDGQALMGARIAVRVRHGDERARDEEPPRPFALTAATTTGSRGDFDFRGLGPGSYSLVVVLSEARSRALGEQLLAWEGAPGVVTLGPGSPRWVGRIELTTVGAE